MSFKQFIRLTILSTLAAWGIWIFLVQTTDPVFAALFEFSLFYLTLFLALTGTTLSVAVAVRVNVRPDTLLFRHVATSFRQSVLLSLLFIGSLMLLSKNLLSWWSVASAIMLLSLIEWYAGSRRRGGQNTEEISEHKNGSTRSL